MTEIQIPQRQWGRSGRLVTEIGLGAAELTSGIYGRPNDDDHAIECVHRALELGITYIDTSPGYGESERILGLALKGTKRDDYFLATKTGTGTKPNDYSRDGTFKSVEHSLQMLKTERLDVVQIHDPTEADVDLAFSESGALGALIKLKSQGTIGAIGIGVRNHDFLRRAIEHGAFDSILTHGDFNLAIQSARDDLFDSAHGRGLAIILGSPILRGYLTDRPFDELLKEHKSDGSDEEASAAKRVRDWCDARGQSTLHLALRYCLREPRVSTMLIGSRTSEEITQNVQAATTPIADEVWNDLERELGVR